MPIFDLNTFDWEYYNKHLPEILEETARCEDEQMKRNREQDKHEGRNDGRIMPWDDVEE